MKDPHIENPIPDDEWKCPKCGSKDEFYIDETFDCGIPDCDRVHPDDVVVCFACHSQWSLKVIIKKWAKTKSMVKCPCCDGKGWIIDQPTNVGKE